MDPQDPTVEYSFPSSSALALRGFKGPRVLPPVPPNLHTLSFPLQGLHRITRILTMGRAMGRAASVKYREEIIPQG